jgi:thiamine-monophosphate kinase
MGATPVAVVVALTVPPDESAQWVEQLRDGMAQECSMAGLALVGGDLTGGATVVVTCTVVGDLAGRPPVKRSGAAHGNVVAQIGPLGMAQAGLAVLSRGFRSPAAAVEAHRRPQPPYGQGAVAAAAGATAMIDVSDGLVADLRHVAESSGVQLQLKSALLPVNDTLRAVAGALGGLDPAGFALDGGDDHALVATFRPEDVPEGWRIIGQVVDAAEHTVLVDERPWTGCGGWEHFASGRPRD